MCKISYILGISLNTSPATTSYTDALRVYKTNNTGPLSTDHSHIAIWLAEPFNTDWLHGNLCGAGHFRLWSDAHLRGDMDDCLILFIGGFDPARLDCVLRTVSGIA